MAEDVDCEDEVVQKKAGFRGRLSAAFGSGAANDIEAAVGDGRVCDFEGRERREIGCANWLPKVIRGHGNEP